MLPRLAEPVLKPIEVLIELDLLLRRVREILDLSNHPFQRDVAQLHFPVSIRRLPAAADVAVIAGEPDFLRRMSMGEERKGKGSEAP